MEHTLSLSCGNDSLQLYNNDCLETMKNIADKSIDCIICDLPFGVSQCKWDNQIPFDKLWEVYERVIKDNGAIVLFGIEPFSSMLRTSNLAIYKYDWIWRKPKGTGHLNAKKQPLRDTENISVFYKKQCVYNPQFSVGKPFTSLKSGKTSKVVESGVTTYGKFMNGSEYRNANSGFRYPKQILEFGIVERNTVHPTQKPVPLIEYLVRTYTNENDIVLDNCMGSGTTGVACVNTNRSFIGIEIDRAYFDIAVKRIDSAVKNKGKG